MLVVSGIGNTFPVFFPALLAEFGGSRAATASAVSLMWIASAALGPVAGQLIDRGSPRRVEALGLSAAALGLLGAMLAPSLPVFIASLGIGAGIGIGLTGMVTQASVIADAYERRRGLATGIAFSGSMGGYVLSAPAHWAITTVGWRGTLAGYMLVVLALVPLALIVYPARLRARGPGAVPEVSGRDRRVAEVFRSLPFWALAFVFMNGPLTGYLVTVQHALYFDALGFPAREAAILLAIGGVLSMSGRALVGLAADRFGALTAGFVTLVMSLAGALSLAGLGLWPSRVLAWAYVLLVFAPMGTRATVVSLLTQRIAPPARFGAVFGWLVGINSLGAGLGPFLSGALYDLTRSYLAVYLTAAGLIALSLAALGIFLVTTSGRDGSR